MKLGAFAGGFAQGLGLASERRERENDRELRRQEIESRKAAMDRLGSQGSAPDTTSASRGALGIGVPYKTDDPEWKEAAPHQKAFLNAVAGPESGGSYNIRYTPKGGQTFAGWEHPRIFEQGPEGKSSAAGRYQFTATTWDDMGGGSFKPVNQDQRAWALAERDYKASTGRDLDTDLQARGLTPEMTAALSGTWRGFKGRGGQNAVATYNASMDRYAPKNWSTMREIVGT